LTAIIFEINSVNPQLRLIKRATDILENDGVIIYPTDTIYGLGSSLFSRIGLERIRLLKGKNNKHPLSFICKDLKDISQYAHVSDAAYKLMRKLLPGPYTFVLPATKLVPKTLQSRQKTVGIRVPDNLICQELLKDFGKPILSTSVSDERGVFNNPKEIEVKFGKHVDMILDGGILVSEPSTVIDFTSEEAVVLRKGAGDISFLVA
jgi:tRNA threonylcarbamoyl adenosine modification protein (Sua5/YciO/YrdC/YwlC family)